jgi:queuine tRNA-ribosyltransferase
MARDGHFNIFNARYVDDFSPVDPTCECRVCAQFTRAYLAHLFRSEEMLGPRLLSEHNVAMLNQLMRDARVAIRNGDWRVLADSLLGRTNPTR